MELTARIFVLTLLIVLLSLVMPLHYLSSLGSGSRPVRAFDTVSLETRGLLRIVQGDSEYLTVEAPSDVARRITVKVRGKKLRIGYRGIFTRAEAIPVFTLGMKDVKALIAAGAGEITAESIVADDLVIETSSSGSISIERLTAESASVRVGASGSVEMGRCRLKKLEAILSSSGNFRIAGEAESASVDCSSSGEVDGADLRTAAAAVRLRSSGGAVLWITDRLEADLSGKGDLRYFGEPHVSKRRVTGSGKVLNLGLK